MMNMENNPDNRIQNGILVAVFACLIVVPLIGAVVQEDERQSIAEKRNLAVLPAMPKSIAELQEWPVAFDAYYSDHFGFRKKLYKFYDRLIAKVDNSGFADNATMGRDDWVFLGSPKAGYQDYGDPFGDAMHVNLYSEIELQLFAENAVSTQEWLAERGAQFIYVIAPNKHTIYFEKLPEGITKQNPESATDQLIAYMSQHTTVPVVDLRPALFAAKESQLIYEAAGTHWNHFGANVRQYEIMKQVDELFPGRVELFLLEPDEFEMVFHPNSDLDGFIVGYKSGGAELPSPVFSEGCIPNITTLDSDIDPVDVTIRKAFTTTCDSGEVSALLFRDSFFQTMEPYVSRQFGRATFVWENMTTEALEAYVESEQPDIVIYEFVERNLPFITPPAPISE